MLDKVYKWVEKHIMPCHSMMIIFATSVLCSCASSKNVKTQTKEEVSEYSETVIHKNDAVENKGSVAVEASVSKQTNTNVKEETLFLSPPDSMGKQYITAIKKSETVIDEDINERFSGEAKNENKSVGNLNADIKSSSVSKTETKENIEAISFLEKFGIKILIALVILFMVYKSVERL